MELLKKTILQAQTTGLTATTSSYKYIIIPDLSVIYHMKIGLIQDTRDIGFFDAYEGGFYPYEYDGEPIGGDNLEIPPETPTVLTGTWSSGSTIFSFIANNQITTDGGDVITELGVLYCEDAAYKTSETLTYENYQAHPTIVIRNSSTIIPSTYPYIYSRKIAVSSNIYTVLYYRAYAINSTGISYGNVKTAYIMGSLLID